MIELRSLPDGCAQRRGGGGCAACEARPFSVCASIPDEDLQRLDAMAQRVVLAPGQALFAEGEAARHVFNITSGSVRLSSLLADGRRHVAGFLHAGDFIGLSPVAEYAVTAEALEPVTACRFDRGRYDALMQDNRELEAALLARAGRELLAAQQQALLLARKTAIERVASFLLDLTDDDPMRPGPAEVVRLTMTRGDIADYLGLTLETVSRCLSRLKQSRLVTQASLRELRIADISRLRTIAIGAKGSERPTV